jgi:hypothetical protein
LIVPFETPGALLEDLRCLAASRPLPTRKGFQGKTMSRFLLITNLRPSEDDRQNVFWRSLRLDRNLNPGLCWNLDRTWRIAFSVLWQTRYRLRLRGCISPHDRSRTNAEHGAKERSPGRPQEKHEDQRKHQKRLPKCRLRVAFMVNVKQHRKERSHFNTPASSTPKPTPSTRRPLAKTTPIATQRRTADRV